MSRSLRGSVLVLYRRGYDIRRVFSVEDYAHEHPEAYYHALRESDRQGEVTSFLEFWSEALSNELSKVKANVLAVSLDKRIRERVGQTYLNSRQWEAVLHLTHNPYLTRSTYQELTKTSEGTARRDLEELVRSKVIAAEGQGKALRYRLNHGRRVTGKWPESIAPGRGRQMAGIWPESAEGGYYRVG